ncbi:MAG: LuxR C-terminal-related transcriptional regulator [Phycisphaerales bacterium]|nr:PAS domain-containing protein [Planctomycetota bacterium]MCH8509123.1 LuxR C-terminal-related transcriptional regulator [Phycisphaerales bacterium]
MPDREYPVLLFTTMSPASIAAIVDDPEVCAAARDTDLRLVWCNSVFAANLDSTPEQMQGTRLADVMTPDQARDREEMMRITLRTGRMAAHQQLWMGKRWLSRVWPLDPDYFGHEGVFILITRLTDSYDLGNAEVRLARTADLGPLEILTPRELEVFYYLAAGMTAGDVARALFRSEKTIGRHLENIHRKMGYTNRAELVRDAVECGLVHFTSDEWKTLVDPQHDA